MNINFIFSIFTPKDRKFFPLFEKMAESLRRASEAMGDLLSCDDKSKIPEICKRIKRAELDGDKLTSQIHKALCETFITPFDREDIDALADKMDGCIDAINRVGQKIMLYSPSKRADFYSKMHSIIADGVSEVELGIAALKSMKHSGADVRKHYKEIKRLEEAADAVYETTIAAIFAEEKDTVELIKQKEILHELEKTVNRIDGVGKVFKSIFIKYA